MIALIRHYTHTSNLVPCSEQWEPRLSWTTQQYCGWLAWIRQRKGLCWAGRLPQSIRPAERQLCKHWKPDGMQISKNDEAQIFNLLIKLVKQWTSARVWFVAIDLEKCMFIFLSHLYVTFKYDSDKDEKGGRRETELDTGGYFVHHKDAAARPARQAAGPGLVRTSSPSLRLRRVEHSS